MGEPNGERAEEVIKVEEKLKLRDNWKVLLYVV